MPHAHEHPQEHARTASGEPSDEPPQRLGFRLARAADLAQIAVLENQSFASDRFSARTLRALATRPSSEMWVAVCAQKIIGYVATLFRCNSGLARVYGLCVASAARGRGVGRALLRKAEQGACRRGCRALRLEVRADNRAALALYASARYVPWRNLPGYYADGCDGVRLQKTLPSLGHQGRQP